MRKYLMDLKIKKGVMFFLDYIEINFFNIYIKELKPYDILDGSVEIISSYDE